MGLLENWQGSRAIMRFLVTHLFCWLGWFSTFALAQFDIGEAVTGTVNFPALGITCVGNLAAFVTTLIRGRLDLEMGARDVLDILLSPKLENIAGIEEGYKNSDQLSTIEKKDLEKEKKRYGLTTCQLSITLDSPENRRFVEEDAAIGGGGDLQTASTGGVPETLFTAEETDLQIASTGGGLEIVSAEDVVKTASTEGGGLQKASTKERVPLIGSEEEPEEAAIGEEAGSKEEEQEDVAIRRGGDLQTASTERVPETASTEENGVQSASTIGPDQTAASSQENVIKTASAEGGCLPTASTEEIIHIDSEGEGDPEEKKEAVRGDSTRKQCLQTASVVILSNGAPNWSMRQFMKSNAHVVDSIQLQYFPLKRALKDENVLKELRGRDTDMSCKCSGPSCHCIVFWTVRDVKDMLDTRMPEILKPLSNSLCLLPCSTCLRKGCHRRLCSIGVGKGCHKRNGDTDSLLSGQGKADEKNTSRESVVCDILHDISDKELFSDRDFSVLKSVCICIPVNDAGLDGWTKLLVTSLRSKDAENRGVRNMASEALQGYLDGGRGREKETVEYDIFSFLVPRLTEILINVVLTFWFRVDGFSSALVARRTVRDYLVDTKSSGFAANAFLTEAVVRSNANNSQVCQLLTFRAYNLIPFISMACVNFICSLGWVLLISFEGGPDSSRPPTMPIVVVLIAAIATPWVGTMFQIFPWNIWEIQELLRTEPVTLPMFMRMTVAALVFLFLAVISPVVLPGHRIVRVLRERHQHPYVYPVIATCLLAEMVCYVSWSVVAGVFGIKPFGRWVYGALQILVWVKWAKGSYLLNQENSIEYRGRNPDRGLLFQYSSAFLLNAVLAGVRCKWEVWPWKDNHLF